MQVKAGAYRIIELRGAQQEAVPHTDLAALSEAVWVFALGLCLCQSHSWCSLQPCGSTPACRRDAAQEGWEVKTITRHMLVLGWEEASGDLLRGKDQSWMHESTSPQGTEQLQG